MKSIEIGNKVIGKGHPLFIIAEAANNHGGNFQIAKDMIIEASRFGADAVKLQCLFLDEFSVEGHPYYEIYQKLEFSEEQWAEMRQLARDKHIPFFIDVLCPKAVKLMKKLEADLLKIHCGDITNYTLLKQAAETGLPLALHTGYANLDEIKTAVDILKEAGCSNPILLYGFQDYPTRMDQLNLNAFKKLRETFDLNVGFMDHTTDIIAPVLSLGFGISVLEKHFSLDRGAKRYDWESSIDPPDFKKMVDLIRDCEKAFGDGRIEPTEDEHKHIPLVRKSIVAEKNIDKGTVIEISMLAFKRTKPGLEPSSVKKLIGAKAARKILRNETITEKDVIE